MAKSDIVLQESDTSSDVSHAELGASCNDTIRDTSNSRRGKADAEEWGYKYTGRDIPEMGIRLSVPKIHVQDTTVFSGWLSCIQHRRKCLQLECAVEEVDFIQDLVKRDKEADLFTPRWVGAGG